MNKTLRSKVLGKIKPSSTENKKINVLVKRFLKDLEISREKLGLKCDFFVGGSFGKGTYLKRDFDIDIFVRFENSEEISLKLGKLLKNANKKAIKQKGSRDYFQVHEHKLKFELVPIKKIADIKKAENTTDHSPLHVEFVKGKIKKNKKLVDEIRLTKQFFKANNLYGAESYIGGFSGHTIDLLVIYYGNFEKVLNSISNWREQTIIDLNKVYKNEKELLLKIEKDKQSNLIIVDPVLKTRNAARALNVENYSKAILIAQKKVNKLEIKDFTIKKTDSKLREKQAKLFVKQNNLKLVLYKISIQDGIQSNDIVGSKLLKIFQRLEIYFKAQEFNVFKSKFFISFDEKTCEFLYFVHKEELPAIKKVMGPRVDMKSDVSRFLKNKKNHFIEKDRIYAYEKRKITNMKQCSKLNKKDFENILGKKVDFIKSIILRL